MQAGVWARAGWRVMVCGWIGLMLLLSGETRAASSSPEKLVLTLQQSVKMALERNPEIREAQEQVKVAESTLAEVKANRYPQIDVTTGIGPSPRARGDQIFSPDDKDDIAFTDVFVFIDARIIQPLYTFGKLSSGIKAATHGVNVDKARVQEKSADIILKVHEFYYGLLLARELQELLTDAKQELIEARQKVQQLLDEGSESVSQVDIFKFDTFTGQLEKFIHEADKSVELAQAALRFTIGLDRETPFDIAAKRLVPEELSLQSLANYVDTARELRPEFIQLQEGLAARKELITVAKREYFPNIFLGAFFYGGQAGNRSTIENPFIYDPFNDQFATVLLGVNWSLNFGKVAAKVQEAEAEYRKLLEKKSFAEAGIPVQVEKAYREIIEAQKNMASTEASYRAARRWLVAAKSNFDLGIGEAKEIADAFAEFLKMRAENLRSIYSYNLALATLDQATGNSIQKFSP